MNGEQSLADQLLDEQARADLLLGRASVAELRRDLQATTQDLSEAHAELGRTRPMADAAHAYMAKWWSEIGETDDPEANALLAAHEATTPSASTASHVVVAVDRLARLEAIERAMDDGPDGWKAGFNTGWRAHELAVVASARRHIHGVVPGEVRVEWGVGDPDDCATDEDVRLIENPGQFSITDRDFGRSLLQRDARLGPWRRADLPISGASA